MVYTFCEEFNRYIYTSFQHGREVKREGDLAFPVLKTLKDFSRVCVVTYISKYHFKCFFFFLRNAGMRKTNKTTYILV